MKLLPFRVWLAVLALFAAPAPSFAAITIAASTGVGMSVSPDARFQGTTLMVAPGWSFLDLVRLELGIAGGFESGYRGRKQGARYELRPMVVITPPIIPLYLRLISGTNQLFSRDRSWLVGAGLGIQISLLKIFGLFAEANFVPRFENEGRSARLLEGRLGVLVTL